MEPNHLDLLANLRSLQQQILTEPFQKPETRLKLYRDIDDMCLKVVADLEPEKTKQKDNELYKNKYF